MAVVFTDSFTAGTTAGLETYAPSSWARIAGSGSSGEVVANASTARAEAPYSGSIGVQRWGLYRCVASGMPTGDQEVTLAVNVSDGRAEVALRTDTGGAATCYLAGSNRGLGNNHRIVRRVAGVDSVLATGGTAAGGTTYTVRATATGTGASVALEVFVGGTSTATFSDTSGSRLTSGTPGVLLLHGAAISPTVTWADNYEVDDPNAGGGATDISFAGTAPLPVLAATVAHAPPVFAITFAGTAPLQAFAATVGHDALPEAPTGLGYTIVAGTPLLAWTPGALRVTGQRLERRLAGG
jgi:hypothetical protein